MSTHVVYSTKQTVTNLIQIDSGEYKFKCKYCSVQKLTKCKIYKDQKNKIYAQCKKCKEFTSKISIGKCNQCNLYFASVKAMLTMYNYTVCPKCDSLDNSVNLAQSQQSSSACIIS